MTDRLFHPPVLVKDSDYLILEIASIGDAIAFLEHWPSRQRDVVHETVLRTCHAAIDGLKPMQVARRAFADFCSKKGMLADMAAAPAPERAPEGRGFGVCR